MIKQLWDRFCEFSFFVQVILILCLMGALVNGVLIWRDLHADPILLRLHIGFFVLYAAQIVFIFLCEKCVAVLTVLQGVLALFTSGDFLFVPLLKTAGEVFYVFHTPYVDEAKVYKYIFVSLAFTLQMFSAYVLFAELSFLQKKTNSPEPETVSAES